MMKKLILSCLFAASACVAQQVTGITLDSLTHSEVRIGFTSTGSWNMVRVRYIQSPGTCTGGTGGTVEGNTTIEIINPAYVVLSGLAPNTSYQVCPELSLNGASWTSGIGTTVTTLPLPSVHPGIPIPPVTFDTSYPDTTGFNQVTVANDCSDLQNDINTAVSNQLNNGTVIQIPAGTVCAGRYTDTVIAPDVKTFPPSAVNTSTNTINLNGHGFTEGQELRFGMNYGCLPGSGGTYGTCFTQGPVIRGMPYYAHVIDSNNFQIYQNAPMASGGTLANLTDQGTGTLEVVSEPRPLHWIIVRTATPDSQFAPEGTRVGPAWAPKMAVLQLPYTGAQGGPGNLANNLMQVGDDNANNMPAYIRFMGLEFTYGPNPYAYTSSDPVPWFYLLTTHQTSEHIVVDRSWFHGLGTPQRVQRAFTWDGMNNAMLYNYFDGFHYFHAAYQGLTVSETSATSFNIAPGAAYFGAGSGSLNATATVSFSGSQSGQNRAFLYFTMTGNQLNVVLPPGISGTCTGVSNCHIVNVAGFGVGMGPNVILTGTAGGIFPNQRGPNYYYVDP